MLLGDDDRGARERRQLGEAAGAVRQSTRSGNDTPRSVARSSTVPIAMMRPAPAIGRPRIVWPFTIVNSMLLTPMPSPSTSRAVTAKPRSRRSKRRGKPDVLSERIEKWKPR